MVNFHEYDTLNEPSTTKLRYAFLLVPVFLLMKLNISGIASRGLDFLVNLGYGNKKEIPFRVHKVIEYNASRSIMEVPFKQYGLKVVIQPDNRESELDIVYTYRGLSSVLVKKNETLKQNQNSTEVTFPNLSCFIAPKQMLISAYISNGDTREEVTDIISDYIGPKCDFHLEDFPREIFPKDLFPFWSQDSWKLELNFKKRSQEILCIFDKNEPISFDFTTLRESMDKSKIKTSPRGEVESLFESGTNDTVSTISSDSNSEVEVEIN